jgi:hypothetical protein
MTVRINKPALNLREELTKAQGVVRYEQRQFWFDANKVTNGTFDDTSGWNLGSGWTISGGTLNAVGAGQYAVQTNVLPSGTTARVTVKWTQTITSGTRLRFFARNATDSNSNPVFVSSSVDGSGSYASGNASGDGTFTLVFDVTDGFTFKLLAETGNSATVDNVSVTSDQDSEFTLPKGFKPVHVYEDGLLQREGTNHDYTVVNTGFEYKIVPTVVGALETCIIAEREL